MVTVEDAIDKKVGEVRTESLDMSFGEILGLYSNKELIIYPEFQRLFRWQPGQESRLIESILLELPIPPVFVMENSDGRLELIDGLQRITSLFHFVDPTVFDDSDLQEPALSNLTEALKLQECDIITELNGLVYEDLPLRLKLRLKRASVRMIIIRRQSSHVLRYEMFKRLNTGGALLSPQEIRNCTVRMLGESGIEFYGFLKKCASNQAFRQCIDGLSDEARSQKGDEELVLRFFALKTDLESFRGSVSDWLDGFLERVVLQQQEFDQASQENDFMRLFSYIAETLGDKAFVRYQDNQPQGGLKPAFFEAVTMGIWECLSEIESKNITRQSVQQCIVKTLQTTDFKEYTGGGANSRSKLRGRIGVITNALNKLLP
jgi:hypothetical protein